jgi:hypothetical protein
MALVSPGVEVTVIDESNYIPAATNSVPYFLIATAQNKISGAGVGVAAGTLEANAGKVYLITSQRDLAATFGVPFFYKTAAGTPINGYELNEYGLLAAYSALGISNRAYVQRANIDLAELTATLVRPTGAPNDGTYWLDTAQTSWGIFQWNQSTGEFSVQTPIVITDTTDLTGQEPKSSVGNIGNYAVVSAFVNTSGTMNHNAVYYKNLDNTWVEVGTDAWRMSWPTLQGTNSVTGSALTPGDTLIINGGVGPTGATITVPGAGTLLSLAQAINAANIQGITAEENLNRTSNRLWLYADCEATDDLSTANGGVIDIDPASTAGLLTTLGIDITASNLFYTPTLQQSPNYVVPRWNTFDSQPRPTGSVWNMTTNVNSGMNIVVKKYDAALGLFVVVPCPVYTNGVQANFVLDPSGGGQNIPAGTLAAFYDAEPEACPTGQYFATFTTEIRERLAAGPLIITGDVVNPTFPGISKSFTIQYSVAGSSSLSSVYTATFSGTTATSFVTAVSEALPSGSPVSAAINSDGNVVFTHSQGGSIVLTDTVDTPVADAGFNTSITGVTDGVGTFTGSLILTYWVPLDYVSSDTAPDQDPATGRFWYYSAVDQVDIMIHNDGVWQGYKNVSTDNRGFNLTQTDPAGPIVSASAPTEQSDGTALVQGDLWIDTSNLELYPVIKRWQQVDGVLQWVTINNTDQTTSNGVLFADARWAPNGTTNPITDTIPTIVSLLTSNYLDIDAPDPGLYPDGMLLFNTRRSGFNVKTFQADYFNGTDFDFPTWSASTSYVVGNKVNYNAALYVCIVNASGSGQSPANTTYWAPLESNAWVTSAGNRADGSPYMGRQAVRQLVVQAMKSAIDTQDTLREEQVQFNLLACPQYPELIVNMVALNNERNNTGFVVGDTPLRLPPTGTDIIAWATNTPGASTDAEAGLVTSDPYLGVFYPSCQTTDLSGSVVVQPPSHMMVRTIIRNDEVAFPWLAPAGVRRGVIDNAEAIGYVNAQTGEFVTIATGQGLRDTLYENKINPITFIPGVGITNYGNKTEAAVASALDRINVARLVAFIRGRLEEIGKTFVFEPNDQITRNEISNAIDGLMIDLVAKRGIYDYLIVCDESNNTPARIDRNELYVDIAIEPVKAVEFIYIPLRIKNTGEIAAGTVAPSATV